jgi:hypothetical protein
MLIDVTIKCIFLTPFNSFRFSWFITFFLKFCTVLGLHRSRVSSGSIVSDYGMDDRAIGVRSPAGAKDFPSILYVQTGSGAHPASCPMGPGGPFPRGLARLGRDGDHSPHLMLRS